MPEISTADGQHLYYRKMGSGPVLLLIHGFPESGSLWENVWDALASTFTLIVPDLPGSGKSTHNGTKSLADMAGGIKAILDSEGIEKAVIAGHSMGGYVGCAFAACYPERLSGLSLVHSTPQADDEEKKKNRQKSVDFIRKGGKRIFLNQMVPNLFADDYIVTNPHIVPEQVDKAMQMEEESIINFITAMMNREDSTAVLGTAPYPVQWIAGTKDKLIDHKKILAHCSRSAINFVSFYNNCGHMSMLEAPGRLAADLGAFTGFCHTRQ